MDKRIQMLLACFLFVVMALHVLPKDTGGVTSGRSMVPGS